MTEKVIIGIVSFIAGGFIGGIGASFLTTRELRRQVKELKLQNEDLIEENKRKAHRGLVEREKGLKNESEKTADKNASNFVNQAGFNDDISEDEKTKINYSKLSKKYRSSSFDEHFETRVGPSDDLEDEEDDEDDLANSTEHGIRLITGKEFSENANYRENETIYYYQEDDVLTDSKNNIIHDHEHTIGTECMGMICDTKEDTLYIDNEIDDILYEIIVNHNEGFYRDVMSNDWQNDYDETDDDLEDNEDEYDY